MLVRIESAKIVFSWLEMVSWCCYSLERLLIISASSKLEATMFSSKSMSSVLNWPRHSSIRRPRSASPSPPFSYKHRLKYENGLARQNTRSHLAAIFPCQVVWLETAGGSTWEHKDWCTHNDGLDEFVAVIEVGDDFVEVSREEVFVAEQLLFSQKLSDLALLGLLTLRHNGHCVVVLLAVKDNVEASFLEFLHVNAVGALGKDLDLVDAHLVLAFSVLPLTLTHLWC